LVFLSDDIIAQVVDSISITDTSLSNIMPKNNVDSSNNNNFILDSKIIRSAKDSVKVNYLEQKAYLYGDAKVEYGTVTLEAAYIEIDFVNNNVYAKGIADTSGVVKGNPIFKDGSDEYQTTEIRYDFNSHKGLVYNVTRQEGDAYLFIKEGKKMEDNTTYVKEGYFSTCSLPNPHYSIKYGIGKIIPDDKIVTGPIHIEIEGIPLPVILPFGFFPNKKGRANGILIPSYGYTENRGYYLSNGGYYTGLGEHIDLAIRGDIYAKGSWAIRGKSNYNFRYKSRGNIDIGYALNKYGETDVIKNNEDKGYFIRWTHNQDPKSNPSSTFSANVNFGSTQYNKLNSVNINDYVTNTFQSSIAYSAKIKHKYNLAINVNHNQNTSTHIMNLDLPTISFSTPRMNPFERKIAIGSKKWYEKISVSYNMDAKNQLSTLDSLFFTSKMTDFKNGISHNIPISSTIPLGHLSWTNSLNLRDYWYFKTVNKYYDPNVIINGKDTGAVITDDVLNFKAAHEASFSSNFSTLIYGMFTFKHGPMTALRHVMSPTIGFSYHPDVSKSFNYFKEYTDKNGKTVRYSIFDGGIFGSPADGKSGNITFNLGNTLEAKLKSAKDTITGIKKIKILEGFNISTSYDLAKKEFQLAPLNVSARTTVLKKIDIQFGGIYDFYAIDSMGVRINELNWKVNKKLLRKNSSLWRLSLGYSLSANDFNGNKNKKYKSEMGTSEELKQVNDFPERYVDFNNQWSLNFNYSFNYAQTFTPTSMDFKKTKTQTLDFSGDVNVTQKWKLGFSSGYDFENKGLGVTSLDIYRDLHCWELMFHWIPLGPRQSYNLTVRVKSPLLQDLKINKKRDWQDY